MIIRGPKPVYHEYNYLNERLFLLQGYEVTERDQSGFERSHIISVSEAEKIYHKLAIDNLKSRYQKLRNNLSEALKLQEDTASLISRISNDMERVADDETKLRNKNR